MSTSRKTQLACTAAPVLQVSVRPISGLRPHPRNARTHSKRQITQIAASIRQFGFTAPVLLGRGDLIVAGHGRVEAARLLGMTSVPAILLGHLSAEELRAYLIADNRLAELAGWDLDLLALELQDLCGLDLDFDLEITGFDGAELDRLLDAGPALDPAADQIPQPCGPAVTRLGDIWNLGDHRLVCGDARDGPSYAALMAGEQARMVFTDPPYNIAIDKNVSGHGKTPRREFAHACGEMSGAEFAGFLAQAMEPMAHASLDGAIHFVCMDWRHMAEILTAGASVYSMLKNLVVWVKTNGGLGSFYRSQHELIFVFKVGAAPHVNTFGMGQSGRYRTNVWTYPAVNAFSKNGEADLALHPTLKPVAMVADAIRDVSRRGEIVLDPFGGSGTTLIAAEKTRRRARLMELDPLYVDVTCRRYATFAGKPAILAETGETFDEVAARRSARLEAH